MSIVINLEKTPAQLFSKSLVRAKYIQHIQLDLKNCGATDLELKIRFLSQSYVLQLVAYWQVFIEELARYGFRQIEASGSGGHFQNIARARLDESLRKFNTPNKSNIDKLFKEALGVSGISQSWTSASITQKMAASTLEKLLEARHQIAHTGQTSASLDYATNFEKMSILMEMAELTENALCRQLTPHSD